MRIAGPRCRFCLLSTALSLFVASFTLLSTANASSWSSGFEGPRANFLETVLEGNVANQKSCKPTGLIQDACCDYQTVEDVNNDLASQLAEIIQLPFFRFQKVNLFQECAFWQEDGSCMNRACAVQETDEEQIPEPWRSGSLGKVKEVIEVPQQVESDFQDSDFCVLDEESPSSEGVYVDLFDNPERFTGYAGVSANRVWKAIYEENCFDVVSFLPPARGMESGGSGYIGSNFINDNTKNVRSLMGSLGLAAPRDEQGDEQCLEKRVYYRLISGLHASISIHICSEYLDQSTGEWKPNLACFITRIAEHPERLQNVYFNYVLMLRALTKSAPYLRNYNFSTGDEERDAKTGRLVEGLLQKAESCQATFDETRMFSGPEAKPLMEEFKSHFRNVSRIMDCVGCDKCRLWGKTQITGLATGLKLLFSFEDESAAIPMTDLSLKRSEIVAFMWTIHRFSESLAAVEEFREMWARREKSKDHQPALNTRQPTQEELMDDAIEKDSIPEKELDNINLAEPAIFSPLSSPHPFRGDLPNSINTSAYHGTTSVGPRMSGLLAKLFDACRSSIAACLAIIERGVAFIAGSMGGDKTEL